MVGWNAEEEGEEGGEEEKSDGSARGVSISDGSGDFELS